MPTHIIVVYLPKINHEKSNILSFQKLQKKNTEIETNKTNK